MNAQCSTFSSKGNLCGTALLRLVCRGHVIIAELLRLSERVPSAFVAAASEASRGKSPADSGSGGYGYVWGLFGSKKEAQSDTLADAADGDEKLYAPLLFDFAYLRSPEKCEADIGSTVAEGTDIRALEAKFASKYGDLLAQFYHVFEGIYLYQQHLNKFAADLSAGYYVRDTNESVLLDTEGRQLLCEAIYLYGMMLILAERRIEGPIRERIIIAFLRYRGKTPELANMNAVCKLFRCTGSPLGRKSQNVCEDKLFARFPLCAKLVQDVICCLVSDDIYFQLESFPSFNHRTTRLAKQASLLYTILYFQPKILEGDKGMMREIVDRFFNDNFVIPLYTGILVDLSVKWERFEAARIALENVLQVSLAKELHISNEQAIKQCSAELRQFLNHGVLTDGFILRNSDKLLDCMRRSNVALRWKIMHKESSSSDSTKESAIRVGDLEVLHMFLLTAHFEETLKTAIIRLLESKDETWRASRSKASSNMTELSKYFDGNHALSDADGGKNEGLVKWFAGMAIEIENISYENDSDFSAADIMTQLCLQSLDEIMLFDQIDRNPHLKATIEDTKDLLLHMAHAANMTSDMLRKIENISDASYAEEVIKSYVPTIHSRIRKDPSTVKLLRSLFLKLASCLNAPTMRLEQSKSSDLKGVKHYYATMLAKFVGDVIEIVPTSVFTLLIQIADMKEKMLIDLPLKIETDSLKEYSQLDERYKLSMLTYELSVFTQGITGMETTRVGDIEIDPIQLLHSGLRKELVRQISATLHHTLRFQHTSGNKAASLVDFKGSAMQALMHAGGRMNGVRKALEHVQDYTGMAGSYTWSKELARIICFNVEQESNKYLQKKVLASESKFQSNDAPIPRYKPTEHEPLYINFMGRTMSALLKMTEPQSTIYSFDCNGWFLSDGNEIVGVRTISLLRRSMGAYGLIGLDKLLSFRILNELQRFVKSYRTAIKSYGVLLEQIRDGLFPEWKTPQDAQLFYESATKKTEKLMSPITICLRRVGQAQLLRRMLRKELQLYTEIDAKQVTHSTKTMSMALVSLNNEHDCAESGLPATEASVTIFEQAIDLLSATGEGDPMATTFLIADPLEGLPVLLALFMISHASKFKYDPDFGSLVRCKDEYPIDGWPFVAGMATLLKQFHPSYAQSVLAYMGQFVRAQLAGGPKKQTKKKEEDGHFTTPELKNTILFANQLCSISSADLTEMFEHIPQYLIELCAA